MAIENEAVPEFHRDCAGRPTAIVIPYTDDGTSARVVPVTCEEFLNADALRSAFQLTPRQARTVQLLYGRRTNKEIADAMGVTVFTARRHVESALAKLGVRSRFDVEGVVLQSMVSRVMA